MTTNKVDIADVLLAVIKTAPAGAEISWEYPGYINIILGDDTLALGEHLSEDTGYNWNNEEGNKAGEIASLEDATEIANTFWIQVSKESE